jgi:hypothetical protein
LISFSLTSQPKAFQLLKPMGGVSASFSGAVARGAEWLFVLLAAREQPATEARNAPKTSVREVAPSPCIMSGFV